MWIVLFVGEFCLRFLADGLDGLLVCHFLLLLILDVHLFDGFSRELNSNLLSLLQFVCLLSLQVNLLGESIQKWCPIQKGRQLKAEYTRRPSSLEIGMFQPGLSARGVLWRFLSIQRLSKSTPS